MATVLIVEDERSIRQALRVELEDAGHEVIYAEDYNEAVSAFKTFNCDVVISDLFLGKGDGVQLLNLVSNEDAKIPFIGITAFPETTLAYKAKTVLKDRLLINPFQSPLIREKVNTILAQGVS